MKKTIGLVSLALVASLSLVACGSKDSTFKDRKTNDIAQVADSDGSQAAAAFGDANNMRIDFAKIDPPIYSNEGGGQGIFIKSVILVNNVEQSVWTNHFNPSYSQSPTSSPAETFVGGTRIRVTSYCRNGSIQCQYYYILVEAFSGAHQLHFGVKYDFANKASSKYIVRSSQGNNLFRNFDNFVSVIDSSL